MIFGLVSDALGDAELAGHLPDRAEPARWQRWRGEGAALACELDDAPAALTGFPFAEDGLVVAARGRLDNLAELADALGLERAGSPARVLLAGYRRWLRELGAHLLGDFAIALVEPRTRTLCLIRDRLGVTPLYYARGDWGVAWSCSARALTRLPFVSSAVDEARAASYLVGLSPDPNASFFREVRAVAPGHAVTLRAGGAARRRYWFPAAEPELRLTEGEYAEEFRARFVRAVARCTAGTDRVAATLSGGLDSSSIACAASLLLGKQVDSFSAVFPEFPSCDEREYIEANVAAARLRPTYTDMSAFDLPTPEMIAGKVDSLETLAWYAIAYAQCLRARESGHRVILFGSFGDLVGGGAHTAVDELFARRAWLALARVGARRELRANIRTAGRLFGQEVFPRGVEWYRRRAAECQLRERFPGLRYLSGTPREIRELRDEAIRLDSARPSSRVALHHLELLTSPAAAQEFRVIADVERLAQVTGRHPFVDAELLDWSLRLPLEARHENGHNRWALRSAMRDVVPDAVRLRRDKTDFIPYWSSLRAGWLDRPSPLVQPSRPSRRPGNLPELRVASWELRARWAYGTVLLWTAESEARP